MRNEQQRAPFVQVHYIRSSSQAFLRTHRSDETGPILNHLQRHLKSKELLMLKTFLCVFSHVTTGEGENLSQVPSSLTLLSITFYFFQFAFTGIVLKISLLHLMPAKTREAKHVSFKFKGWLQGSHPTRPQPPGWLRSPLSRDSSLLWLIIALKIPIFLTRVVEKQSSFSCSLRSDLPFCRAAFF